MKHIVCIILIISIVGCSKKNKFESEISKPEWFDSIEAPQIDTFDEADALWRSDKLTSADPDIVLKNSRIVYKSCFNAISEHYEDEELVVLCLGVMDIILVSNNRIQTTKFLVENFGHHKNSVARCACLSGDIIARATLRLAKYEGRLINPEEESIRLLENLLDNRVDEISYWIQAEIYEYLGTLYIVTGLDESRLNRMKEVYDRFNRVKASKKSLKRRYDSFEKVYQLILEQAPNKQINQDK